MTKGGEHKVKIEYKRALEELDDLTFISFTDYNSQTFLDFTGSTTWYSGYKLGIIVIYIDNTLKPVLEVPVNIGKIASHDDLTTVNPSGGLQDGLMAGKSFVGFSSTTSNSTDQAAAFQFFDWTFTEIDKCRITTLE